ncbi:hypothetical protein GGS24DRAFT_342275 [Hypoxylon argillaceum]|nr:hypothetical protein GGS24DRAFT_342275 [Hypoxylon argillaceum]
MFIMNFILLHGFPRPISCSARILWATSHTLRLYLGKALNLLVINDIMSLPIILLYQNLGSCNIILEKATYHLVGVIDWRGAKVHPFGLNLYSISAVLRMSQSRLQLVIMRTNTTT